MAIYFKRWLKRKSRGRGLVCHFYISQSDKQYYDKTDYAGFNLFSSGREWLIKGTTGHGIKSARRRTSNVPCLNCFEVNDEFHEALKKLESDNKFDIGIVFNKRILRNVFKGKVINVIAGFPKPHPPLSKCHHFDNPYAKAGVLRPFNYCDIVRIETPVSEYKDFPIASIPAKAVVGMLVKKGMKRIVKRSLQKKNMQHVDVFDVL